MNQEYKDKLKIAITELFCADVYSSNHDWLDKVEDIIKYILIDSGAMTEEEIQKIADGHMKEIDI